MNASVTIASKNWNKNVAEISRWDNAAHSCELNVINLSLYEKPSLSKQKCGADRFIRR